MNASRLFAVLLAGLFALTTRTSHAADPATSSTTEPATRPNVVFILVDDLGMHDLSITGSEFYHTPNIDQLFRDGIQFSNGYAACRVCSPSRASIHTGQFTARHGVTQWIGAASGSDWKRGDPLLPADYLHALPAEQTTLPETLRDNGYQTFFAGKWHLGGKGSLPTDHGYEINKGGFDSGSPRGGYFSPFKNPYLNDNVPGESLTLRLADETSQFMRTRDSQKPFFAMLSFYSVHGPIQTTEPLWKKYQQQWQSNHPLSPDNYTRFRVDQSWPVREVQDNPIYAGMVETTDTAVGRVLETLRDLNLTDNTIVCFTSDNGGVSSGDAYATSNLPLRGGKGRPYEGGIREPFALRFPPRIPAAATNETPVSGPDWYPTILDLCGLPLLPQQHADGQSLLPVIDAGNVPDRMRDRPLYWHYPQYDNQGGYPSSIIRIGQWKLIHFYEDDHDELYRLTDDVGERSDVSMSHPETVTRLRNQLMRFLDSVDAKFPQPNPNFDAKKYESDNERRQTGGMRALERQHANYLSPDFSPNSNWWGSQP